jgi:hypothetical protein
MAPNTTLNTGAGVLVVELRDGAGKTYADSGAIHLQNVVASSVVVSNANTAPNSDLTLGGAVNTTGAQRYHTPHGMTTVAASLSTSNAPISFDGNVVLNPGVTLSNGSSAVALTGAGPQTLQATGAKLGNLTHSGAGTLRLLGPLTLGGALRNTGGSFDANGQAMTVKGAAIFNSGVYRPDVMIQTFTGDVTFQAGATLRVDLNGPVGQFSQLQVGGVVNLSGSTLQIVTGFSPGLNSSFKIIDNNSNSSVVGSFAGLPQGATLVANGLAFQISYQGGDGNDVVLTVVPTPAGTPTPISTSTSPPTSPTPPATPEATITVTPDPRNGDQNIYLPLITR